MSIIMQPDDGKRAVNCRFQVEACCMRHQQLINRKMQMKITRQGAGANHGLSSITLRNPKISWREEQKIIEIDKGNVKDFNNEAHHNYIISFSLDEAGSIIQALSSAADKNPELLSKMHPQILKFLLQIQLAIVESSPLK
jgi:hypothetical protein